MPCVALDWLHAGQAPEVGHPFPTHTNQVTMRTQAQMVGQASQDRALRGALESLVKTIYLQ